MGVGPTTMAWVHRRGRSKAGGQGIAGKIVGENRLQFVITKLRIILGMSSPVHHELGERRMRYGPKGTRAYARKPYCDAWGDMVPALFPDEEEMEFAEQPNAPIQETTVRRQILMPHFQRAAEYRRLYQGQGTFQFAPEVDMTPPTRGRGRPRKTGPTREGPGPIRMEDSVPTRKQGRPRKILSIDAESLRSITGVCRCGTLMQARQGPRSVREYTEEFLESAKRCKPKTAEDWCRWYKAGLREEIWGKLIGVLEPWEFALVNRMAGQAMEAERTLTRRVVAISSSEEDVEVEEDPSEDSEWEEEPASSTGSGRAAGSKPEGEQKSPKRSPAENSRRSEALAVDSFSLPRAASLFFLSFRRVSLSSLSPRRASFSPLSLHAASLSPRHEQPRVVVVAGGINYPGRVERKKRGGRSVQKRRRCGAIASDKNGRVRIEAPVRLSHAESWWERVVIHCKGGPYPRNWATGLPGQATSQEAARKGEEWSA
ncbi:hypothetical protein IGI04_035983 [Brassica rapa subsp. trilocularis]|uniref:Retrotransposon gag domain-containing protein n=1 Tax=Brassica rapa subsp. trilocularis TaxID=1813537 RepID=A0ABQ7LD58_BRACM|nr:hypothetical protein IGI04_035983 [Brassica rapa subsp. trilocularis]